MAGFISYSEHTGASGGGELTAAEELWVQTQAAEWANGFIDNETPTVVPDGIIKDFPSANTPSPESSLRIYVNGSRRTLDEDYTYLTGGGASFIRAPRDGSIIRYAYRY